MKTGSVKTSVVPKTITVRLSRSTRAKIAALLELHEVPMSEFCRLFEEDMNHYSFADGFYEEGFVYPNRAAAERIARKWFGKGRSEWQVIFIENGRQVRATFKNPDWVGPTISELRPRGLLPDGDCGRAPAALRIA